MSWSAYLAVPQHKALYDVHHARDRESAMESAEAIESILAFLEEHGETLSSIPDKGMTKITARDLTALCNLYDKAGAIHDYELMDKLFAATMLKYHPDAYFVESEEQLERLQKEGYSLILKDNEP